MRHTVYPYSITSTHNVDAPAEPTLQPPRLLDEVRRVIRACHCSLRTEEQCVHWVRSHVSYHRMCHPREMGAAEVEAYLTHLAADRHVAPATHRQALWWPNCSTAPACESPKHCACATRMSTSIGGGGVQSPLDSLPALLAA